MTARQARVPPLNPVLARELKQRMRGRHVWLVLTLYLAVLAVILRWVYVAASRESSLDGAVEVLASATVGRAVFQWLLFFMLLLVCFIVPGLTAGAISGERERQTLISLQITLLRPRSIVLGKLLASLAFVVLLIIASVPLLTVPFLVGGVSVSEVAKGLVMVLATAVTLACMGLACSALLRRTQAATVVAYGITLALVLGTLMVYGAQQIPRRAGEPRPDPWILAVNPFAATADVVAGRSDFDRFESPFRPLQELLVLSEEDRFSQVITGPAEAGVIMGPNGQVFRVPPPPQIAPVPPRMPVTTIGPGGGFGGGFSGPVDMPGGPGPGMAVDIFPADQGPGEEVPRLGGVRFWVMSLWSWLLLAVVAAVLTVRRIRLTKARETS
ncbi:MAG TPA: ABC transporter permease subunit [Acidimicrobiales bacterium]|nr:ABC transporter permease subunit [Acidimicrobiales bacterium]